MLNEVITIIVISTLPFMTGWYLGAFCQRRVDDRETTCLKERQRIELENAFNEQAIVSNQFFNANQRQRVTQVGQIGDVVAASRHRVELIAEELKHVDSILNDVFSVLEEVRGYRNRMIESVILAHGKFDRIVHSIPSYKESAELLQGVHTLLGEIEEKSVRMRSIAAEVNLLSTNAAMEASRAGESGRDFAVFADCVQRLAGKSTGVIMGIYGSFDKTRLDIDRIIQQFEYDSEPLRQDADDVLSSFNDLENIMTRLDEITSRSGSGLDRSKKMIQELENKIHALTDSLFSGLAEILDATDFETPEKLVGSSESDSLPHQ